MTTLLNPWLEKHILYHDEKFYFKKEFKYRKIAIITCSEGLYLLQVYFGLVEHIFLSKSIILSPDCPFNVTTFGFGLVWTWLAFPLSAVLSHWWVCEFLKIHCPLWSCYGMPHYLIIRTCTNEYFWIFQALCMYRKYFANTYRFPGSGSVKTIILIRDKPTKNIVQENALVFCQN